MQTLKHWLLAAATLALCACGGSDNSITNARRGRSAGGGLAARLTLLTSSPQIPSDGSASATITALVRDATNNVVPGQAVQFTATSGALVAAQPSTTDKNGVVTATLEHRGRPDEPHDHGHGHERQRSRAPLASASRAPRSRSTVRPRCRRGSTGKYNVVLTTGAGAGIANKSVTITSSKANGISQTPIFTDGTGSASFNLTANNNGVDTLTASALGIQATISVNVSSDAFVFSSPAANTEVALGTPVAVTVNWKKNNAAVANAPITFSTTRGTLSAGSANTNASATRP